MQWIRTRFKGKDVWAQVGSDGMYAVDGGRVPIRYSDKAGARIYRAGASRIAEPRGEPVELPAGEAAPEGGGGSRGGSGGGRRGRSSGYGSAGTRTEAQAAAARTSCVGRRSRRS